METTPFSETGKPRLLCTLYEHLVVDDIHTSRTAQSSFPVTRVMLDTQTAFLTAGQTGQRLLDELLSFSFASPNNARHIHTLSILFYNKYVLMIARAAVIKNGQSRIENALSYHVTVLNSLCLIIHLLLLLPDHILEACHIIF